MASDGGGVAQLEDPLEAYSGLTLLPRTLVSQSNPPKLADLQDTHSFLKSISVRSPGRLLEEAKYIVGSSSELRGNKNEAAATTSSQENNRERRPGLGRKRARFSLKPNSSQPTVSLEPTLDVAKLKDPEEFFSVFEKLENAKNELQRQTGSVLTEIDEDKLFTVAPRPRRAGISGRTVKYKHRYAVSLSPQDTFEKDGSGPCDQSLEEESINANLQYEEMDLDGSITKTENTINELLDELLTGSCEELDGDKAINILREHLQIKPINLEKLSLPDLGDIHKIDLKASRPMPQGPRNSLPDIHSVLKNVPINKTPSKPINAESSASPSPLASMSLLKKRLLKSNLLSDPFSAEDIDLLPPRNASPAKSINQQSEQVDTEKASSAFGDLNSSTIKDNDPAVANMGADVGGSGSHADIEDNTEYAGTDHGIAAHEDNAEDAGMDHMVVNEDKAGDADMDDRVVNEDRVADVDVHQSIPAATEDRVMDECSNIVDSVLKHYNQNVQESTRVPLKEQRKRPSCPSKEHKNKGQSRRQSLAVSGTSWENGARRSTRIKSRPLEYWKGERFLYGCIHQTTVGLPTVIGLKYKSPTKEDARSALKVKSYVSNDYKELVDLAALH